jgi:hypothetical protein
MFCRGGRGACLVSTRGGGGRRGRRWRRRHTRAQCWRATRRERASPCGNCSTAGPRALGDLQGWDVPTRQRPRSSTGSPRPARIPSRLTGRGEGGLALVLCLRPLSLCPCVLLATRHTRALTRRVTSARQAWPSLSVALCGVFFCGNARGLAQSFEWGDQFARLLVVACGRTGNTIDASLEKQEVTAQHGGAFCEGAQVEQWSRRPFVRSALARRRRQRQPRLLNFARRAPSCLTLSCRR